MSNTYWQDRIANAQSKITEKNRKQIDTQLRNYYKKTAQRVMLDFENTYEKILKSMEDGKKPTPADLYKLDKYWQLQGQMRQELQKLGEKQIAALTKQFQLNFFDVYYSYALDGAPAFNTLDIEGVTQMINSIWCADGKSWSSRVWDNTSKLAETLNEELIHCVASGKPTGDLKRLLQERFSVSYSQADSLVRTEMAHIQTQAAQKRYEDYGIQYVEVWADEDERRCPVCAKLHKKRVPIGAQMPIPAHPRCRCCVIPVVEDIERKEVEEYNPLRNDKEYQDTIRAKKEAYKNRASILDRQKPNFSTMSNENISKWSKDNLKASVNFSGATDEVRKIAIKTLYDLKELGIDLEGIKIEFGGTKGMYGGYIPNTKTIHLRKNTNFIERMLDEDIKAQYKLGKPQHAVSTYRGMMTHEIGHAIDALSGFELSKKMASNVDLFKKGVSISNYAGASPALGVNKASETFAENFSAYMDKNARERIAPEIRELIEEYLKKNRLKKK